MDRAFFSSKEFVIATVLFGGLLLVGAVVGLSANGGVQLTGHVGCDVGSHGGTPLEPTRDEERRRGGQTRIVHEIADAEGRAGGIVDVCTEVGTLTISPSADGNIHVVVTITNTHAGGEEAVDAIDVRTAYRVQGGQLAVSAWLPEGSSATSPWFWGGSHSTSVNIEVEVPANGRYDVRASTDVGDVQVVSLRTGELDISTDVGDIEARSIDVGGTVHLTTDVGDIDLAIASIVSTALFASTDVGDVRITAPGSSDIGYDLKLAADVGSIEVAIGETEHYDHREDGASEDVEGRSRGYTQRAVKVTAHLTTDVGHIDFIAT